MKKNMFPDKTCFVWILSMSEEIVVILSKKTDPMESKIRVATPEDRLDIVRIFNYYIENTFTAYPEKPIDDRYIDYISESCFPGQVYVVEMANGNIAGFGLIKRIAPISVFDHTGEVGYFILPEYVKLGIGTKMLDFMTTQAKSLGITTLLASISSLNPISIRFHLKNGFRQCGVFEKAGIKRNSPFDMVWMQKDI